MQLAMVFGIQPKAAKEPTSTRVMLTNRDFEILEFILEMKFAAAEDIFFKFFKTTQDDELARNDQWAKKRLTQLERAGFLKSLRHHFDKGTFYVSTFKAYFALLNLYPEKTFCKPVLTIDTRTFTHDRMVLKSRLLLEERSKVNFWVSDRNLRNDPSLLLGFKTAQVPDAIFDQPDGKKIAFEIEIARKAKVRYREKIRHYVSYLRNPSSDKRKLNAVWFVVAQDAVREVLVKETKIYGAFFKIQSIFEFNQELNRGIYDEGQ